jgi:hypothetical protein
MADTPNIRHDEQVPTGAATGVEARLFHNIVGKLEDLPPGVRRVEFHFGEDSEGAPAVWITFIAGDDLKPSKEKIADLQKVASEVRAEIFRSDTERWPYVEIVTE